MRAASSRRSAEVSAVRYLTFGRRTGLRVSEYCLGTGNFGTGWGAGADAGESRQMFDRFAEAGGTLLDTADSYQRDTESERMLGEFLVHDRDHFVVATKYTNGAGAKPRVSETGNSRKNMVRSLEGSLRRLRTDYVDIYWAHFPDRMTPLEEVVRAFDDLVRAGKILHGALSNFPAWQVARAATIAELRGWAPVAGIQVEYSLADRTADRELLPMSEALGLAATFYHPLAGGLLTGKYRSDAEGRMTIRARGYHTEDTQQRTAVVTVLLEVAAELGVPPAQVAMAWLRGRAGRSATALIPVIGPRTVQQLDDYLSALDVSLPADQFGRLSDISSAAMGVPHEAAEAQQPALAGGHPELMVPPAVPVA
jgi:aryl-alcohol dehydrogenase-like predicted oxidoreductase